MSTYCPELWKSFTIDNKGNVYSCCLVKPIQMGSIYDTELKELTNSPAIVRERENSLKGRLRCYSNCNWIDKGNSEPSGEISGYVNYLDMSYLHLNFGERCNIACVMCKQRSRYAKNPWILSPAALKRNVDISPFKDVVIQGGEPLFIPECREYMRYLGDIGKKYTLLTNGLLINDDTADELSRNAKIVCISLNAASKEVHERVNRGSRWETVMDNIRRMIDARSRNSTALEIWGRMTVTAYSLHEVPRYLRESRKLGFDRINFGFDRETVPALLADAEYKARLRRDVTLAISTSDLKGIDVTRLRQLGLFDEGA